MCRELICQVAWYVSVAHNLEPKPLRLQERLQLDKMSLTKLVQANPSVLSRGLTRASSLSLTCRGSLNDGITHDQRLQPRSPIFHCGSLEDVSVEVHGTVTSIIGFGGLTNGQLILLHTNLTF